MDGSDPKLNNLDGGSPSDIPTVVDGGTPQNDAGFDGGNP